MTSCGSRRRISFSRVPLLCLVRFYYEVSPVGGRSPRLGTHGLTSRVKLALDPAPGAPLPAKEYRHVLSSEACLAKCFTNKHRNDEQAGLILSSQLARVKSRWRVSVGRLISTVVPQHTSSLAAFSGTMTVVAVIPAGMSSAGVESQTLLFLGVLHSSVGETRREWTFLSTIFFSQSHPRSPFMVPWSRHCLRLLMRLF